MCFIDEDSGSGSRTWSSSIIESSAANIIGGTVAINQTNGDLYAVYAEGDLGAKTIDIFYKISKNVGASWTPKSDTLNAAQRDHRYIRSNLMNENTLYVIYYDVSNEEVYGSFVPETLPPSAYIDDTIYCF